jgi:hypothetical protein
MLSLTAIRRWLGVCAVLAAAFTLAACRVEPWPKPLFRADLRPLGFSTEELGRMVGSFTDIGFLSNDLLLVTVNTRTFAADDTAPSDLPESKLLLFDLQRRALVKSAVMPVEKSQESVQSAGNGSFVLLNRAGVQICSPELECGTPVQTRGPLYVSPRGTRIAVGGHGRWEQTIFDAGNMAALQSFGDNEPKVVPGDNGLLYTQKGKLYVVFAGDPEPHFVLDNVGTSVWPEARFLNANTIAAVQSDKTMAIVNVDGKVLFRLPLSAGAYVAQVSTSASGARFCFHDAGYRGLRALLNFGNLDLPYNLERVNVVDIPSGKSRFRLRWDPRPYVRHLSRPALSPDGHRLAIIRRGFLEVYEIR